MGVACIHCELANMLISQTKGISTHPTPKAGGHATPILPTYIHGSANGY
jgi:hypothetical protein